MRKERNPINFEEGQDFDWVYKYKLYQGRVLRMTEKAIMVYFESYDYINVYGLTWIPKSIIEHDTREGVYKVPHWFELDSVKAFGKKDLIRLEKEGKLARTMLTTSNGNLYGKKVKEEDI